MILYDIYTVQQNGICRPKIPNDESFLLWSDTLTDQGIKIKYKESIYFVYNNDLKIMSLDYLATNIGIRTKVMLY